MNDVALSDDVLLEKAAQVLDRLGPFAPGAPRSEKWRTTDALASELGLESAAEIDRLDGVLRAHEADAVALLEADDEPGALVRRAKYPDRTTALPLWGSARWHGQPWRGSRRTDDPEDEPMSLRTQEGAPTVFLSHTYHDTIRAYSLAESLAALGVRTWRFETRIDQGADIADCVRTAIGDADCVAVLLSGHSIASLWVLTELHTALGHGHRIGVILDTDNPLLTDLLESARYPHPDGDFDTSVQYSDDALCGLEAHYGRFETPSRLDRYRQQVRDFLATAPSYLRPWEPEGSDAWMPLFAFPHVPQRWRGLLGVEPLSGLAARLS